MQKDYCLTALTPSQIQCLTDLIETCRRWEPIRLHFPADGDLFLFICEDEMVVSCIIVCKAQEDLWECYAFTRPDVRKKGLFSALLDQLCQIVPENTELVFLLDHQSPDALAAADALAMELWRREYVMECTIPEKAPFSDHLSGDYSDDCSDNSSNHSGNCSFSAPSMTLTSEEFWENELHGWVFSAFSVFSSANPIGSCRILAYDNSHFYLYHVEIDKAYRNQGWGTQLVHAVIHELPENASLRLHVSETNKAAVKLYQKTGFRLTETLSYYLY